jgi:RES domain
MPAPTRKKVAGKVASPPSQAQFNKRALRKYCTRLTGKIFRRLHVLKPGTTTPWPAIYFSTDGRTRFDPVGGIGTICVGTSLGGAMMEKFDDSWGPAGDDSRSLTEQQLCETWETLVHLPDVDLFDASGGNPSKIGADAQLVTGEYTITRDWALLMMLHPDAIDGILFPSRHDLSRRNIALFARARFLPSRYDGNLSMANIATWAPNPADAGQVIFGPEKLLRDHPDLGPTLIELEVARMP